ncbi:dynein axonemal assembly factor 6 [Falco biarmicus]|uniref:dynein axonemal assembly factor 6 n=1 Tax=Falco cherrug TaxID=345164 RepID=UPI000FFB8077|nr:dynein axonemal assembly factor 6 [Falco cherrug]XP_027662302.1 dynein axonemal assembly factor 6 [Falco cherrug]XP_037264341.1 dynein assembly factor 6, axonemal [Falco rusticolus]XP_037264342.1 dynein assembly factor 6, axonemal [Falco rusticolus]XP_040470434.1 dynein assembly factor 6, axonemal [Falco naumanni]XP_040470435.1 dynein assembly factor 6, axonemal [Falco naumanni]XP_040470437.1 dynein assembly factor 6, axonemal [Falco naumanni]XP_056216085.1 dynein axonemal assembly factor
MDSASSLQYLAKLLSNAQEGDDDDDEHVPHCSVSSMTPGSIGPVKRETAGTSQVKSETRKTIWNTEEVPEGSEYDDTWDPREQPEYQILFKQCVGTEDVFFGMSRKDHSTACCEDMVIKIKLPETKYSDITLDIQDKVLDLRTPQKKLLLHLPYPVDSKNGKACFLSEEETLEVTLRLSREFDFINFF